jgi:predicted transcriptional regulator
MPTSVHIPEPLLRALDKKAKALKVSRNSLIIQAIERELGAAKGWPSGFFESIVAGVDDEDRAEFDESMRAVVAQRRSKKPIDF